MFRCCLCVSDGQREGDRREAEEIPAKIRNIRMSHRCMRGKEFPTGKYD